MILLHHDRARRKSELEKILCDFLRESGSVSKNTRIISLSDRKSSLRNIFYYHNQINQYPETRRAP